MDQIEEGCSVTVTTEFVNIYRRQHNLALFGATYIYHTTKRLRPLVSTIGPKKQVSHDKTSPWVVAWKNLVRQLLIRFGINKAKDFLRKTTPPLSILKSIYAITSLVLIRLHFGTRHTRKYILVKEVKW